MVSELFPLKQSDWGTKLTAHLNLVPRLRMRETIPPLSRTFTWRGAYLTAGTLPLPLRISGV